MAIMTYDELHKILDNKNRKISISEFQDILYKMKADAFYQQTKNFDVCDNKYQWYLGEANGLQLALDLSRHIIDLNEQNRKQICNEIRNTSYFDEFLNIYQIHDEQLYKIEKENKNI